MGAERQAPAEEEHGDQSQADKVQRVDSCWPVKLGMQQNRFYCIKVRSGRRPIHGWESVAVVTRGASSQRRAVEGRDLAAGAPLEQLPSLPYRPAVFC